MIVSPHTFTCTHPLIQSDLGAVHTKRVLHLKTQDKGQWNGEKTAQP